MLTATIVIPAYNEEANILSLLNSIMFQHESNFIIEKVIVISDGSTDKTEQYVKELNNSKIHLMADRKRVGKPTRLNQAFEKCNTDILIQFDADVKLKDNYVVSNLVETLISERAEIAFGVSGPAHVNKLIEKIAYFGYCIWEDAKEKLGKAADRYRSVGQIRAFTREFYSVFRLPTGIGSAEDSYSFYFAKQKGFKIISVSSAMVYFQFPTTINDYIKQMARYLRNSMVMEQYYDVEFVKKYDTITPIVKLKSFISVSFKTSPHIVILYLLIQSLSKLSAKLLPNKPLWDVSTSTKDLIV